MLHVHTVHNNLEFGAPHKMENSAIHERESAGYDNSESERESWRSRHAVLVLKVYLALEAATVKLLWGTFLMQYILTS